MKTVLLSFWVTILTCACQNVNPIEGFPSQSVRAIIIRQFGQNYTFIKRKGILGYDYIIHSQKKQYTLSERQFQAVCESINNIQKNIHSFAFQKMYQVCEEDEKHWVHLRNTSLSISLYSNTLNKHYHWNCFDINSLPYPQKKYFQELFEILKEIKK